MRELPSKECVKMCLCIYMEYIFVLKMNSHHKKAG